KVAGDRVEQRRLSRAVRAKNRPPLAGLNRKVDVGGGDKGAERAADTLELQRKGAVGRKAFGDVAVDHCGRASLSCSGQRQLGLSPLATPSFIKSASGMPSVWLTAGMTLT